MGSARPPPSAPPPTAGSGSRRARARLRARADRWPGRVRRAGAGDRGQIDAALGGQTTSFGRGRPPGPERQPDPPLLDRGCARSPVPPARPRPPTPGGRPRLPEAGASTSAVALSVWTSIRGWPRSTVSPGRRSQRTRVPSSWAWPRAGITTGTGTRRPAGPQERPRPRPLPPRPSRLRWDPVSRTAAARVPPSGPAAPGRPPVACDADALHLASSATQRYGATGLASIVTGRSPAPGFGWR